MQDNRKFDWQGENVAPFISKKYFWQIIAIALVAAAASAQRQWPAGVSPAACPNYPFCGEESPVLAYASLGAGPATQWPAGVSPASCPNYPNCFQERTASVSLLLLRGDFPPKGHRVCASRK